MFERFTNRARHIVVLAQEEARGLQHNYIGTEHLLLGLLGEPESVAGRVLHQFGLSLSPVREDLATMLGTGRKAPSGHIPFTPRAKKVLELALREALTLGHNSIGTEHILLGMLRQDEGPAVELITARAGDLVKVRAAVIDAVPVQRGSGAAQWARRAEPGSLGPGGELRTTPAADSSLNTAARLAGLRPVGSHHLLLAALSDPQSAAVRALVLGPGPAGGRRRLIHARVPPCSLPPVGTGVGAGGHPWRCTSWKKSRTIRSSPAAESWS